MKVNQRPPCRFTLITSLSLLAWLLVQTATAQTNVLVQDDFNEAAGNPDSTRFNWSGQVGLNGAGQLVLSTDTANTSWVQSQAAATNTASRTIDLQFTASAYAEDWNPGIYGDAQPRGLRVGTDANNVIEFYSVNGSTVGMRTRNNGNQSSASYTLPGTGVYSMHLYQISVTETAAVFKVDGIVAGVLTNNLPAGPLDFYVETFDGYAGNVPVSVDSMELEFTTAGATPAPAPSSLSATAVCGGKIDFAWNDTATNETAAFFQQKTGDGPWRTIATLQPNATHYRAGSIMPGQTYSFRICTTNNFGTTCSPTLAVQPELLGTANILSWGQSGWNLTSPPNSLTNVVAVAAGVYGNTALRADGTVAGWGAATAVTGVPALTNIVAIAASQFGLALSAAGTVTGWGDDNYGNDNPPAGLSNVVAIAAGDYFSLALTPDGKITAWGWSGFNATSVPADLTNAVAIDAGRYNGLALRNDGRVAGWGDNRYGQINIPANATNIVAIAAGAWHSLALKADGTVIGWGNNDNGQCTPPAGLTNVIAIAAGDGFSMAMNTDHTIVCWGNNSDGKTNTPANLGMASAFDAGDMAAHAVQGRYTISHEPFISSVTPACAPAGATITLSGSHLDSTTNVTLNGVPLGFTPVSPTELAATIPPGMAVGTSGPVYAATTNGAAFSAQNFLVCSPLTDFTYQTNNNTITIAGYTGNASTVVVPPVIGTNPVTAIGDNAFRLKFNLNNVTLPDTVTSIGAYAFYSSHLQSIHFPLALQSIGTCAFQSTSLSSLSLPANVTSIGSYAFSYCTSLTSIEIPKNAGIGDSAFYFATALQNITVDPANPNYTSTNGVLFSKNLGTLILFPLGRSGDYSVPTNTTSIAGKAFAYCKLTTVNLPASVQSIGAEAFDSCPNLTAINVDPANTAFSSSDGALLDAAQATLYQVPGGKSAYTIPPTVKTIAAEAFQKCTRITQIDIPDSVTTINQQAFDYCSSLQKVILSANLQSIGAYAFYGDSSLNQAYCRDNLPSIGNNAFGATGVTFYYLPNTTGWQDPVASRSTVLWNPNFAAAALTPGSFNFTVTGSTNIPITIESAQTPGGPWTTITNTTVVNGSIRCTDSTATNAARFYRIRSP